MPLVLFLYEQFDDTMVKRKRTKGKQRFTKHTHETKDGVKRTH